MDLNDLSQFRSTFPENYNLYYPKDSSEPGLRFDIVMRILPEPASRIFSGKKTFELRKYVPQHTGLMFLLETGRTNLITGCIYFDSVLSDTLENLWAAVGEKATKKTRFDQYFEGKKFGVALQIKDFQRFRKPIDPSEIYTRFPDMPPPPHPYVYLYTPVGRDLSNFLRKPAGDIIARNALY
jgi:predicted transcriptional regulator